MTCWKIIRNMRFSLFAARVHCNSSRLEFRSRARRRQKTPESCRHLQKCHKLRMAGQNVLLSITKMCCQKLQATCCMEIHATWKKCDKKLMQNDRKWTHHERKWMQHERNMKGNECKMERKMKRHWKESERKWMQMKSIWKEMNTKRKEYECTAKGIWM